MTRYYLPQVPESEEIMLEGSEAHHLLHVRRVQPGNMVTLFDNEENEYQARVVACRRKKVVLEIISSRSCVVEYTLDYCLAQGLLKSKSWDLLLQKTMELNLPALVPMQTEHTAVGDLRAQNPDRWQKILLAAAKQCGRSKILKLLPARTFKQMLEQSQDFDLRLLAHCTPELPHIKEILNQFSAKPQKLLIMVGPEGGFSNQEVNLAAEAGFQVVSLGPHTLRAETAALTAVANLEFYYS